jgi:hypothetical protein
MLKWKNLIMVGSSEELSKWWDAEGKSGGLYKIVEGHQFAKTGQKIFVAGTNEKEKTSIIGSVLNTF